MLEDDWYIACESRALRRRPGAVTLFDSPVVLFRDAAGRPHALEDRCLHRGAPLSQGRVTDNALECPYHGWRYTGDGRVAEIPAAPQDSAPPADACLRSYPCLEQDGYVWVCPSGSPARDAPIPFAHLGERGWTSFRMRTRFEAPVDACLENFLDCPHATFVHRFWFRAPTAKPVKTITHTLADGASTEYFEEPREKSVIWSLLSAKHAHMRHTDRFIAPATSRVDYEFSDGRYYIITSSCTPIGAHETQVYTVISFRFGRIGALVRLFFEPLSHLIIRQDTKMLRLQQANLRRFGGPPFRVTEQDVLIRHILAWRKALREGQPPPEPGDVTHAPMRL